MVISDRLMPEDRILPPVGLPELTVDYYTLEMVKLEAEIRKFDRLRELGVVI